MNIFNVEKVEIKISPQDHFKSQLGIIKIAQFIVGVALLFLHPPIWLALVIYPAAFLTLVWIWMYGFSLQSKYPKVPWILMELGSTIGATLFYAIMTVVTFFVHFFSTAMIFGLVNTAFYAYGSFLCWRSPMMQGVVDHSDGSV